MRVKWWQVIVVAVLSLVLLAGTIMYIVAGPNGTVEEDNSGVVSSIQEDSRDNSAVQAVGGTGNPLFFEGRAFGWRDVLDVVAIATVVVLIVVLWVASYIRDRNDPLKQWEKKL